MMHWEMIIGVSGLVCTILIMCGGVLAFAYKMAHNHFNDMRKDIKEWLSATVKPLQEDVQMIKEVLLGKDDDRKCQ